MKFDLKKIILGSLLSLTLFLTMSSVVYAQVSPKLYPPNVGLPGSTSADPRGIIQNIIIDILLPVAGIIAVLFLIWGGFRYITSAGSEEVAESAKKTIQNAIIGLVVIILSYVIVNVVINAFVN